MSDENQTVASHRQQHKFQQGTGSTREGLPACGICWQEESFIYHTALPGDQCADCQNGSYLHMGKGHVNLIHLCDKHAAVAALIAALKGTSLRKLSDGSLCWCRPYLVEHRTECAAARAALALATTEEKEK